jgi:hypothetical protein
MDVRNRILAILTLAALALVVAPAMATAPTVKTVPWNPLKDQATQQCVYGYHHTTYDGYNMLLMGVAEDHDGDAALASYEWNFGDGSPAVSGGLSGTGPVNLDIRHVYAGHADGTPLTATLEVCDTNGDCTVDPFKVLVKAKTIDIEINVAIDEGLWWLHKVIMGKGNDGATGQPIGYWYASYGGGFTAGPTASAVQAFLINSHFPENGGGDAAEDPYIDTVVRGLNHMFRTLYRQNTSNQYCAATGSFNPDSDGNGYSLGVNSSRTLYESGIVMEAIAATGTPDVQAVTGIPEVLGRSYKVQLRCRQLGCSVGRNRTTNPEGHVRYRDPRLREEPEREMALRQSRIFRRIRLHRTR